MSVITDRACGICRGGVGAGVIVVDKFFQFFAGLEIRDSFGGNAHGVARLGISASPGTTLAHAKTPKTAQFNLLALIKGFNDAFKNNFD